MQKFPNNPALYEINTRVWLHQFDEGKHRATLKNIPDSYWAGLQKKGMHVIWLMGVWQINADALHENDLSDELRKGYDQALPDWSEEDVIGSPYAIDEYIVAEDLGGPTALAFVRKQLARFNLRLMLDFVPNHFSRASGLLRKQPEVFVQSGHENERPDDYNAGLFFSDPKTKIEFAHGRDPFFAPWWDTVQVNYAAAEARKYMTDVLQSIAEQCDGVRCDMAMLVMNDIFVQTWQPQVAMKIPETEFWVDAINDVKKDHPDFIFMAEAYWDKEWALQQQGFDYTYDKRLTDRLEEGDVSAVQGHLHANIDFQMRSVRFLENHDEPRAVASFGREASMAAAVLISSLPGMHFYYDGQFEGKAVRLPVQLGREQFEESDIEIQEFYEKLLSIVNDPIIHSGEWQLLTPVMAWDGNASFRNILAWQWSYKKKIRIIVINFSEYTCQCKLFINTPLINNMINFEDNLAGTKYHYNNNDISKNGLFVELNSFKSHMFLINSSDL